MKYKPNRGGHGPGFLRDAFQEWVEEEAQEKNTVIIDDEENHSSGSVDSCGIALTFCLMVIVVCLIFPPAQPMPKQCGISNVVFKFARKKKKEKLNHDKLLKK